MASVRQDLEEALRQYEEEEKKRKERELREKEERIRQTAQNDVESMYEPYLNGNEGNLDRLEFDGEELTWFENNQPVWKKMAMSGDRGFQCQEFQNMKDKGPIPEGNWMVKQKDLQNYDDLSSSEKALSTVGGITGKIFKYPLGKWPGGKVAWGKNRVWLTPDQQTNTYGRNNFSIHGGNFYGSSGCIDLTGNMDEFAQRLRRYHKDIPLRVKYRKKCW